MALDKDGNVIPAFRPDNPDMYGGGRMTNFIATIARAYLAPFHGKESRKHFLSGYMDLVDVVMRDGSEHEDMTRRWSAGFFRSDFGIGTFPSNDGVTPAGGTEADYLALATGDAAINEGDEELYRGVTVCGGKISPTSEWNQLLNSIMKAPVDGQDGPWTGWGTDATCLTGLRVEFVLVGREGGGKGKAGTKDGDNDQQTLVVARIVSAPTGAAAVATAKPAVTATATKTTAPAAVTAVTAAAATNGASTALDDEVAGHLFAALSTAPNTTLTVLQMAQETQKLLAQRPKDMRVMVPRVARPEFHVDRPWTFVAGKHITLAS